MANYTGVKSHTSSYLEIGVAVVEAVLLFGFAIPLWAARVDRMPPESEALVVQVTGEQFAWNVHYAGPDGIFGRTDIKLLDLQSNPLGLDRSDPAAKDDVTTLNQLYLPVNKPIIVRLRSKDVIHSFGVPEFRVKQDAIPGLTIPIWFVPNVTTAEMRTRTGNPEFQYEIACAQLCGLGHARMRGFVTVQTAEEFQKWMDGKDQGAERTGPLPVARLRTSRRAARLRRDARSVPRAPRLVYTRLRVANAHIRSDIAVAAWLEPREPRVTMRLASAYFKHEVRHEDQQKQPDSYPESGGEFHRQSSSAGSKCKA